MRYSKKPNEILHEQLKNIRLITEGLYHAEDEQLVEDYSSSFDMNHFKSLKQFKSRIAYCKEHLVRVGAGSSRIVYAIDDKLVLKLAKNRKGIAQNEVEADHSKERMFNSAFARVHENHPDFHWVEMDRAKRAKNSDFKRILGFSFEVFVDLLDYLVNATKTKFKYLSKHFDDPQAVIDELYEEDSILTTLQGYIIDFRLPQGDFQRINSYGVIGDKIVVVDYGYTQDVQNLYYS